MHTIGLLNHNKLFYEVFNDFLNKNRQFICLFNEKEFRPNLINKSVNLLLINLDKFELNNIVRIPKIYPDTKIITLSNTDHLINFLNTFKKMNVHGYLLIDDFLNNIMYYLELVLNDNIAITPEIVRQLIQYYQITPNQKASLLSNREKDVVDALAMGYTYKKIAELLHISIGTVFTHIKNIYEKLDVKSKSEIILLRSQGSI